MFELAAASNKLKNSSPQNAMLKRQYFIDKFCAKFDKNQVYINHYK